MVTRPPAPSPAGHAPLLVLADVAVQFDGVMALRGAGFAVAPGEICGLIGPNGAGKTTLFNCISGLCRPDRGTIAFAGAAIAGQAPQRIVRRGISRTFQNLGLYPEMSVLENVQLGGHPVSSGGFLDAVLHRPNMAREERRLAEAAQECLGRVGLADQADRPASSLPYGSLKRVEIARALMARPRLLLLDEPAGGLTHGEVEALAHLVRNLRDGDGLTVLLVEHHMRLVMSLCEHVVVLHLGSVIADGTPAEVQRHPEVINAYLGRAA